MKFENIAVYNFEHALYGMRLPLQSHSKSDSHYCLPNSCITCKYGGCQEPRDDAYHWDPCAGNVDWIPYFIGENDMSLAQRLIKGGSVHAKFLRQLFVSVDITAPMYWWSEADTYKVGTVANSTSKMHKLASTPITIDCFETDDFDKEWLKKTGVEPITDTWIEDIIDLLEELREKYNETKDKRYWKELIRWLPESFLQTRTWTANYEVLRNIYHWRRTHKLTEWQKFCTEFIEKLPYAKELILYNNTPET